MAEGMVVRGFLLLILSAAGYSMTCEKCTTPNCGATTTCSGDDPICGVIFKANKDFELTRCGHFTSSNLNIKPPVCTTLPQTGQWMCLCDTDLCNKIVNYPSGWTVLSPSEKSPTTGSAIKQNLGTVPVLIPAILIIQATLGINAK